MFTQNVFIVQHAHECTGRCSHVVWASASAHMQVCACSGWLSTRMWLIIRSRGTPLQESSSCPRVNKLGNLVTLLETASTLQVNKPVSNTYEIVFLSKQCPRVLQKCPSLDTFGHELLSCCGAHEQELSWV